MKEKRINCSKGSESSIGEWRDNIRAAKQFVGREGEGHLDWKIQYKGDTVGVELSCMTPKGGGVSACPLPLTPGT